MLVLVLGPDDRDAVLWVLLHEECATVSVATDKRPSQEEAGGGCTTWGRRRRVGRGVTKGLAG